MPLRDRGSRRGLRRERDAVYSDNPGRGGQGRHRRDRRAHGLGLDFVFQALHQGLVNVDGDTATTHFTITEWARRTKDGRGILFLGVYRDDVVRTEAGWRFARRRLLPRMMGRPDFLNGQLHNIALEGQ